LVTLRALRVQALSRIGYSVRKTKKLWDEQGGLCYWCHKETFLQGDPRRFRPKTGKLSGKAATLDHLFPAGDPRRGLERRAIVMACSSCNGKRGKKDPDEFRKWIEARLALFPHGRIGKPP
jgi:5-methylcytosine-specific restriction endonuclease McrA